MKSRLMFPLLLLSLTVLSMVGCGTSSGGAFDLVGQWEGRAERAAERTLREWPGTSKPASEAEVKDADPTDLELLDELKLHMTFQAGDNIQLDWAGQQKRSGKWMFISTEATRGVLEIALEQEEANESATPAASEQELRRFEIEFLAPVEGEPDRFVLNEEGAESRFGRLLFERQSL